jgi:uncharacterized membrane protein
VQKGFLTRWRGNFLTGLAVVLPAVISIAVVVWLFRNISSVTDTLLFLVPPRLTHRNAGEGPMYWYWSFLALVLAICLICGIGILARNYFGRKIIEWVEAAMMRVPFLNKIYGATKQINEAFTSGDKNAFKTVVLIEFPHPGTYALGFITGQPDPEVLRARAAQNLVCVFVPATPNPTSGFLLLVPENKVIKLEMSVADGIKYIISLGSIMPEVTPPADQRVKR